MFVCFDYYREHLFNFPVVSQDSETRPLICSYDFLSQKFEIKGAMQYPISRCAVASSKNRVYIIAGKLNGSKSSSVEMYLRTANNTKTVSGRLSLFST